MTDQLSQTHRSSLLSQDEPVFNFSSCPEKKYFILNQKYRQKQFSCVKSLIFHKKYTVFEKSNMNYGNKCTENRVWNHFQIPKLIFCAPSYSYIFEKIPKYFRNWNYTKSKFSKNLFSKNYSFQLTYDYCFSCFFVVDFKKYF